MILSSGPVNNQPVASLILTKVAIGIRIVICMLWLAILAAYAGDSGRDLLHNSEYMCQVLLSRKMSREGANILSPSSAFLARHRTDNYVLGGQAACQMPIKYQGELDSCWAESGAHIIERNVFKVSGKHIPLSTDYFVAMHLYLQALDRLDSKHSPTSVEVGGYISSLANIIEKFGAVPESKWIPKVSLRANRRVIDLLSTHLNIIVGAMWHERQRLMYDYEYKKLKKKQYKAASLAMRQASEESILQIIENFTGYLPEGFEFEGKLLSPLEFADQYLLQEQPIAHILASKDSRSYTPEVYSSQEILDAVVNQLEVSREPVAVIFDWDSTFVDSASGIATIEGYIPFASLLEGPSHVTGHDYQSIARYSPHAQRDTLGHMVVVTDYAKDERGQIEKLLVRNSWGQASGDQGYYHVYRDFFLAKIQSAQINSK